jgi:hypothetical protein
MIAEQKTNFTQLLTEETVEVVTKSEAVAKPYSDFETDIIRQETINIWDERRNVHEQSEFMTHSFRSKRSRWLICFAN